MRTTVYNGTRYLKSGLAVAAIAALTACSASEPKVPKEDLLNIFIPFAVSELESWGPGNSEGQAALAAYERKRVSPIDIAEYDCTDVATDTYDCSGKIKLVGIPSATKPIDFKGRFVWKEGKLSMVGRATVNGQEV